MSINKLIVDTLKPLNIQVAFQEVTNPKFPYITFFQYNETGNSYAENKELATDYYYQIDIWSKTDYTQLAENVLNLMQSAGFKRNTSIDLYESDTKIYHKGIRFLYTQKN